MFYRWREYYVTILFFLVVIEKGVSQGVLCSTTSGCGLQDLQATTVPGCCVQPEALTYRPSPSSESCSLCLVYGWVQDIAEDRSSAQPQRDITAAEGQEITLNIFFTKNGHLNTLDFRFLIDTSGTATEDVDYRLSHGQLRIFSSVNTPIPVNLTLLNDRVAGEALENLTLTVIDDPRFPPNENEILVYDRVTITIQDNDIATGFAKREVTISEGTEAVVCLKTEGVPALNTTIDVKLVPGTADEKDLNLLTTEVLITATDTEPCVRFLAPAGDTQDLQRLETLTLRLTAPANVRLQNDSLSVFIEDSDGLVVCSKESDCSNSFTTKAVTDCCVMEGGLTYQNGTGTCSQCMVDKADREKTNDGGNSSHLEIILPVVIGVLVLISLLVVSVLVVTCVLRQKKKSRYVL